MLVDARPLTFGDCVAWARLQFQACFANSIAQLLHNFPTDQTTSTGQPFWSGSKRPPAPIAFDLADPLHLQVKSKYTNTIII
jgi:ubiquitin-activating enzyme E1